MAYAASRGRIYLITCCATGKVYVGQTKRSLSERLAGHFGAALKWGVKTHLANAIRKHGPDSFSIRLLAECDTESMNDMEQHYVSTFASNDPGRGYNMSIGGDNGNNSRGIEVRRKISAAKSGIRRGPLSEDTKQRISAANSGRRRSPEQCERIRKSRSYGPLTTTHREKIRASLRRVAVLKLSAAELDSVRSSLEERTDAQLAVAFSVSRKMIWRIRRGNGKVTP